MVKRWSSLKLSPTLICLCLWIGLADFQPLREEVLLILSNRVAMYSNLPSKIIKWAAPFAPVLSWFWAVLTYQDKTIIHNALIGNHYKLILFHHSIGKQNHCHSTALKIVVSHLLIHHVASQPSANYPLLYQTKPCWTTEWHVWGFICLIC